MTNPFYAEIYNLRLWTEKDTLHIRYSIQYRILFSETLISDYLLFRKILSNDVRPERDENSEARHEGPDGESSAPEPDGSEDDVQSEGVAVHQS